MHSKSRVLEEGSLALMRIPDQCGKLSDVWDGPYQIVRKVTPVTYELALNKWKKRVIAHINRLKKWHSPEAIALRVVVVVADEEEDQTVETSQVAHSTGNELTN